MQASVPNLIVIGKFEFLLCIYKDKDLGLSMVSLESKLVDKP